MAIDMTTMIDYDTALGLLATVQPNVKQAISRLLEEWLPGTPPSTIMMASVGRTLASNVLTEAEREQAFSLVERLLVGGDETVKNAVATGLLEAVLGMASANKCDFRQISPFLGVESKRYCQEWDRFTGCRTPGLG